MRIESVTAHAFGPLAGETLELAPGLTVVAGVNESAKSSWHAALYAALCGRSRGDAAPTPEDHRLVDRYKPWDGSPWLLSTVVVLDDGRRLEVCQDLDDGGRSRVVELAVEDGVRTERGDAGPTGTDVTHEILTAGAPDASRWLGLDRSAFAAVALVNQAEHRAVQDAADGLRTYLQRAAEGARLDGAAASAMAALDRFAQERFGRDEAGPLALAEKRVRLAREARVLARRHHEQYLAELTAVGERRAAVAHDTARLHATEQTLRALQQVRDAARTADEARRAAERTRVELAEATTAYETAAARSTRLAALQAQVPEQNSGPDAGPTGPGEPDGARVDDAAPDPESRALLDAVAAARTAWDAAPVPPPLEGPSARQLRQELAALPENGVDPDVRALAEAHTEALAAAADAEQAEHRAPRPSPRPSPAGPDQLRRVADVLDAPPTRTAAAEADDPELIELTSAVEAACAWQRDATEAAQTAEQEAANAAERYRRMRAAAPAAGARRRGRAGGRLRTLTLTILAVGLGLAALYFGLLAAFVYSALVILPVAVSLLAAVVLVVRAVKRAQGGPDGTDASGRPVVEDLVGAVVAVREKETAAQRAREEARAADQLVAECRARRDAALRGERPDPARERAEAWCARNGLRAEPVALRALAARTEEENARRDAERARLAAAVAHTGDALRAALRERGILDQGSPVDQFARYEQQAGRPDGRRVELERALAARIAAEEAAAEIVSVRRAAVAQLRSVAGAAGLDTAGEPEVLVRALDGWRAARVARAPRAAVAVAERPRTETAAGPARELAALLDGASPTDLRREEETLRAARDECLTAAWSADLNACEARRRRDDLAAAAGVDPVRAGDRAFVDMLVQVAQADLNRARRAVGDRAPVGDVSAEGPGVAHADEEVEAAEAELRRIEQLRRTTALTRRYLARAQEQAHRDIAPVLAETLRTWLPGVTRGRYVDAIVDPETLRIQVYGSAGRWRPADRLSAGTSDQVYLLLRVALAKHLATTGETCPLLLDGVTAQADGERTSEILDLLLGLAAERQVVLFTQEEEVLRWAREHLDGDRHRIRELTRLAVA